MEINRILLPESAPKICNHEFMGLAKTWFQNEIYTIINILEHFFVNIYIFSFNIFIFCMVFTTCVDIGSDSIFWSSKTIYLLTTRRRLSVISFRFMPSATSATLQSKWLNLSRGVVGHFQYCHLITRNLSINSNSQKKLKSYVLK